MQGFSFIRTRKRSASFEALFSPEGTAANSPGRKPGGFGHGDSRSPAKGGTKTGATGCVAPSGLRWTMRHDSPGLCPGLFSVAAPRLTRCAALMAFFMLILGSTVTARDAIEDGRDALNSNTDYPWYDPDTDSLRPTSLPEIKEPESDESEVDSSADLSMNLSGGSAGFMQVLFWIFIAALFIGLVVLMVWAFLRHQRQEDDNDETQVVESSSDVDRIEQLPFTVRQPQGNLLDEARRCYEAGDFREAIIYLYSYKLVELDKHHFIHLAKGKTNRQYLREVRPQPRVIPLLERTMVAFEDVFFGDHVLDRSRFETCWSGLGEFHQIMQGGVA